MNLLLDTSTPECHLVLCVGDETILDDRWLADRELAEKIFTYIETQLSSVEKTWSDIRGIGVMKGPGSFTGLRIGVSLLNTLAADKQLPIVGVTGKNWQEHAITRLSRGDDDKIVLPEYGRTARITSPRK